MNGLNKMREKQKITSFECIRWIEKLTIVTHKVTNHRIFRSEAHYYFKYDERENRKKRVKL